MSYTPDTLARLQADAAQIIARYPDGHSRSALLPMLHLIQSVDGYVSPNGIDFIAATLDLPRAEISAVATFYTQYKRHPTGDYLVGVCTNALCAVMGGDEIWEKVSEKVGVGSDETSEDGKITLERIECNAACDYAPVVMVNWEFFDNQSPESALEMIEDIQAGRDIHPTRGPIDARRTEPRLIVALHIHRAVTAATINEARTPCALWCSRCSRRNERAATMPRPTPSAIGARITHRPGAVSGTAPRSGMGGIGPVPATAGECSESVAVRKPAPDHHEAAHAMTVGANASWAPTINAVSAPEAAPRIS